MLCKDFKSDVLLSGQAVEGLRGNRLFLQPIEEIGCYRDPHEDQYPNTSSEKIVVVEQLPPGTLRYVMPKEKFKGDCHAEPQQTNADGLPG